MSQPSFVQTKELHSYLKVDPAKDDQFTAVYASIRDLDIVGQLP